MDNVLEIPNKLKNDFAKFFNSDLFSINEAPLFFALSCFQELYIKNISLGLNAIDKKILETLKNSIKAEFGKRLINMNSFDFVEDYNNTRYEKPVLRLVPKNMDDYSFFERINNVISSENDINYEKVRATFLTNKIGVSVELDLNYFPRIYELYNIFEKLIKETSGVSTQSLITSKSFCEGVNFYSINPFLDHEFSEKKIVIMSICHDKALESFVLKKTIQLVKKDLLFLYKKGDMTSEVDYSGNTIIGIKQVKVYNDDYGQKAFFNLE